MYTHNRFTDKIFRIGESKREFHINRVFLANISPVFHAMLFGQMRESQHNTAVIIHDINANAFECVLKYGYCGNPDVTYKEVLDVIHICDKYQITFLKEKCYSYFKKCLTTKNVCYLLDKAVKLKPESIIDD